MSFSEGCFKLGFPSGPTLTSTDNALYLVMIATLVLKMAKEIVSFPIENCDFPPFFVSHTTFLVELPMQKVDIFPYFLSRFTNG